MKQLIPPPYRSRYIAGFLCFLVISISGCTEDKDSNSPPIKPQANFFVTKTKTKTKTNTNVSRYVADVSNTPISLTQVRSPYERCEFLVENQLEFSTFSHSAGLCLLEYTVSNSYKQSSAQNAITVSSSNGEIDYLPQIYRNIHVDDGAATIDVIYEIESLTGDDYSLYDVMPDTAVIGGGTAQVYNNDITFTPSGYGEVSVYYTLQNNSKEVAVGSLVFAVSDSNQAPSAQDLKYPSPINYDQKLTIDIGQLKDTNGNPIVSSPDGDPLYLASVISLEANVTVVPANGLLSFTLIVPALARKTQDVTYVVSDRKGGYASGIIRFEMGAPPPSFILNDTGMEGCTTETGTERNLDCNLKVHNGIAIPAPQDGHIGRDALNREGKLQKKGAGHAGFDFTKIDSKGNELPESAANWSCIQDNITGRLWEIKTNDGTIRDDSQTFTWYNSDPKLNGGQPGTENGGNCTGSTACDTEKYVQYLNNTALCGRNDWRLPFRSEMMSIFDYSLDLTTNLSIIPPDYFNATSRYYWVGESFGGQNKDQALYVNPQNHSMYGQDKSYQSAVLAVAGQTYDDLLRTDRYTFHQDGTVDDTVTGLMWARCLSGQTWDGSSCQGTAAWHTWGLHIEAAKKSRLGGYSDWRMPSVKELYSIADIIPAPLNTQRVPPRSFSINTNQNRLVTSTQDPLHDDSMTPIYPNGIISFAKVPKTYPSHALFCRGGI
ncbi:DUF1566 domain-containing protein [Vibrio chagasii]|uniref:Lcl C-terminal domain-containing protein n=1 Tax=Vibrio chagasii TaxID=170679 RepID=UPI003DA0F93A